METETVKPRTKMKQPPYEELVAEAVNARHQARGEDAVIETRRGYGATCRLICLRPD